MRLSLKVVGAAQLQARLGKGLRRVRNLKPLWRFVSIHIISELQRNMSAGTDHRGRRLADVEKWTRTSRAGVGKKRLSSMTPLIATGRLRSSIGIVQMSPTKLTIGFKGKFQRIADDIAEGKAGWMKVKPKLVKTNASGGDYLRVRSNSGRWYTKKVFGGMVNILPKKRPFFGLSRRSQRLVKREANRWMRRKLWR